MTQEDKVVSLYMKYIKLLIITHMIKTIQSYTYTRKIVLTQGVDITATEPDSHHTGHA